MRLAYLFLANYADVMPDGRITVIGADFNTLNTPVLPVVAPFFYVVGKAYFDIDELDRAVPFRLGALGPDGNELLRPRLDLALMPRNNNDPDFPASMGLAVLIQGGLIPKSGDSECTVG